MRLWEQWLDLHHEDALLPELALVDPHHHLWDRGGHTYLPPELRADARGHRVEATVYVECLCGYRDTGPEPLRCVGETEFVMQQSAAPAPGGFQASPQRSAQHEEPVDIAAGIVGRADLALGDAVAAVLDAHLEAGGARFKGIRYVSAWDADPSVHTAYPTHAQMLREPQVQAGVRQLGRRSLVLDLWAYFHQLDDVAVLASACPDQVLVLDHFGGPIGIGPYAGQREQVFQRWRQAMRALGAVPNLYVKLGGLAMAVAGFGWRDRAVPPTSVELAQAWRPYVEVCLEAFGPQRCMFESNFPVDRTGCSYGVVWNAFKRLALALSASERSALCADTARRVYRIAGAQPGG